MLKDKLMKLKDDRDKLLAAKKKLEFDYREETDPVKQAQIVAKIKHVEAAMSTYTSIAKNWSSIEEKGLAKLKKETRIKDDSFEDDLNVSLREKNYDKSSLEEDGKSKTSYRLRRFFTGITDRTKNGKERTGFLGLPSYVGFSRVYDTVAQILSSPVETESNFETMMAKLKEAKDTHAWIPDLIEKLENADKQMQKEFVYNYTKHSLSMKFAMYSLTPQGNYSLKIYDTNSHEISRLIKNTWKTNFTISDLVAVVDEEYAIDKLKASLLILLVMSFTGCAIIPVATEQAWDVNSLKDTERTFEIQEQTIKVKGKWKDITFDEGWYVVSSDHIKLFNENQDTLIQTLTALKTYKEAQQKQQAQQQQAQAQQGKEKQEKEKPKSSKKEDVVDAEYKEVDDDKKEEK
jgi:hypothetical protein